MGLFDIFKKDGKSKHKQRRQKSNKAKGGQQGKQQTNQPPQEQQQPQQQSQAPPSSSRSPTSRLGPSPVHHSPTSHAPTAQTNGTSATAGATTRHAHKSPARSVQSFDLERELATPHLEPSSPVTSVYQKTYDCVAFVLHCPSHGKVAVARSPTEAIWLPYVQKHQKMSWYDSAKEGAMQVLAEGSASRFEAFRRKAPFDQLLLLEVARVQMPSTNKFVARYIFYVRLNVPATAAETESGQPTSAATETTASKAGFKCCTDTARLQWLAIDFVSQGFIRNCWGPELVELARLVMEATVKTAEEGGPSPPPVFRQRLQEQSVEQLFEILPRLDGPVQVHDTYTESLRKIKTNKNDIERLFSDYLDHCYPSFYMTYDSFRHYLSRNGFEKNETRLKRFFRAFNRAANGYLSFNELLLGLICMERETPHVEFRIRFVFNYYDTRSRTVLSQEDFALIVADMNVDKHGRVVLNEGQIQRKAAEAMACFRTKPAEGGEEGAPAVVTFSSFLQGVGSHAFRGTSTLCRSRCNVFAKVNRRIAARAVKMNASVAKGRLARLVTRKGYQGSCQGCRAKKYRVAAHLAVVGVDGYLLLASSEDGQSVAFEELQPPAQSPGAATAEESGTSSSEQSVANFAAEPRSDIISDALKLMALIRLYNESKPRAGAGLGKPMHGLMTEQEDRESLVRLLRAIASEIIPLLASEPRCKPVTSPVYIIGDVHGNLEDLLSMERTLWRRFPEVNGMHYLFLGDYVDRGRWSVECALYLFAMKILRPGNVTLLRGNHEVRDIQVKYTYYYECRSKYGDTHGQEVWALSNRIFDHMPLCAVVDENIYCAHGGLPYSAQTLEEICSSIPVELVNPEHECDVAWEIMWSDPMAPEMFREAIQLLDAEQIARLRPGFIYNTKRATAFFFNDQGAGTFLADNQLTHIIRAHEVPKFGFIFHFNFKCTTIFSCSHYCGNDNDCAVVFVDRAWMRIIRIDTSANVSATD